MTEWILQGVIMVAVLIIGCAAMATFYGAIMVGLTTGQLDWWAVWR